MFIGYCEKCYNVHGSGIISSWICFYFLQIIYLEVGFPGSYSSMYYFWKNLHIVFYLHQFTFPTAVTRVPLFFTSSPILVLCFFLTVTLTDVGCYVTSPRFWFEFYWWIMMLTRGTFSCTCCPFIIIFLGKYLFKVFAHF